VVSAAVSVAVALVAAALRVVGKILILIQEF